MNEEKSVTRYTADVLFFGINEKKLRIKIND